MTNTNHPTTQKEERVTLKDSIYFIAVMQLFTVPMWLYSWRGGLGLSSVILAISIFTIEKVKVDLKRKDTKPNE